jgi:putative DNA primase/helicase
LASRFLILLLTNSFYGKEDHGLTDRIILELPGILNWSLEGWDRLKKRRYFVQPTSSAAAQRDFEDLGSPIGAFLRDRCTIDAQGKIQPDELYALWVDWCRDQNITYVGTVQAFGRDLRSVVSNLKVTKPRVGGVPVRHYEGVRKATPEEREAR